MVKSLDLQAYTQVVSKRSVYILEGRNTPGCIATYAALLSAGMSFLIAEPGKRIFKMQEGFRFSGLYVQKMKNVHQAKFLQKYAMRR